MKSFLSLVLVNLLMIELDGRHFLGGTITWRPVNNSATGSPIAVIVIQTYSWTHSLMMCSNTMITGNQLVPAYGSVSSNKLRCIVNCGLSSAGYTDLDVLPYCTDGSFNLDTTVGQRSDIVNLTVDANFSVAFQDTAWRNLAMGINLNWSVSSSINLKLRSDNHRYNTAPVATVMSPIKIPVNQSTVIHVPIADADQDVLQCRWSRNSNGIDECGDVCPPISLPPNTTIYSNCTIIITGQRVGDWFAITLMVEDFINIASPSPLSSVPVQFLVHVVAPPSCTIPPDVVGLLPKQSCTPVTVGHTFNSQIVSMNYCGSSVIIDDIATLSFSGMYKSNVIQLNSSIYYKNISWTPTTAQLGYQVMCAMAINSQNSQSSQYCFTFYVSTNVLCSCPGYSCATTAVESLTRENNQTDQTKWILIGVFPGLLLLSLMILCSYLLWRYLNSYSDKKKNPEVITMHELYYIGKCVNQECYESKKPTNDCAQENNQQDVNFIRKKSHSEISLAKVKLFDDTNQVEHEKKVAEVKLEETNDKIESVPSVKTETEPFACSLLHHTLKSGHAQSNNESCHICNSTRNIKVTPVRKTMNQVKKSSNTSVNVNLKKTKLIHIASAHRQNTMNRDLQSQNENNRSKSKSLNELSVLGHSENQTIDKQNTNRKNQINQITSTVKRVQKQNA